MFKVIRNNSVESEEIQIANRRKRTNITSQACTECRQRKIRCSGTFPCDACVWYKIGNRCHYEPKASRRKSLVETVNSFRNVMSIIETLFPNMLLDDLVGKNKQQLLKILQESGNSIQQLSPKLCHAAENVEEISNSATSNGEFSWKEMDWTKSHNADDVNGLSFSLTESSYLGPSSVSTALRTITKLSPVSFSQVGLSPSEKDERSKSANHKKRNEPDMSIAKQIQLIESYFEAVHSFVPLIDKKTFWKTFHSRKIQTKSWKGLLCMVLTLGSVASSMADSDEDIGYYQQARKYISLDSLGDGSIENLQALALMGGFYLHFRHQPNAAVALTGSVVRLACSLCLHREYGSKSDDLFEKSQLKRRIWWTIYCMDIWGMTTMGRPPWNITGQGITVKLPTNFDPDSGVPVVGQITEVSPLLANVSLCRIISKVEELLTASNILEYDDIMSIDNELTSWYKTLAPYLRLDSCPPKYLAVCCAIKWRYQNARIIVYRNTLLSASLKKVKLEDLDYQEATCVTQCRSLACQTIADIIHELGGNMQMSSWNAVWFLFQAVLVLIVSLYSEDRENHDLSKIWQEHVEKAILFIDELSTWSSTAKDTHKILSLLYDYSKQIRVPVTTETTHNEDWDEIWQDILHYNWTDSSGLFEQQLPLFYNLNK